MLSVEMRWQLTCFHQMGDPRDQRLLESLRGAPAVRRRICSSTRSPARHSAAATSSSLFGK
jgi:hypothetical protein